MIKDTIINSSYPHGKIKYIVAGLGNPGNEYNNTRHNAGFIALDKIASMIESDFNSLKFEGICSDCYINNNRILLLKPMTFMNESGKSIFNAMSFYKIPIERVIVIFDDISIPLGKIRIKKNGSDGGHNGIKSIINVCGSNNFSRIKIGVGQKPDPRWNLADWVLSKFSDSEIKLLSNATDMVCNSLKLIIKGSIEEAMNNFN